MNTLERLALALHEADLGERCKARGKGLDSHIGAYLPVAVRIVGDLHSRWQPKDPPEDVMASPLRRGA